MLDSADEDLCASGTESQGFAEVVIGSETYSPVGIQPRGERSEFTFEAALIT